MTATIASAAGVALQVCCCHWITEPHGAQIARLCVEHQNQYQVARGQFRLWPTVERWMDTEADARDYAGIIKAGHQGPGYATTSAFYPIAGRYLVLGHFYSTE
jgi:hypothetical protein